MTNGKQEKPSEIDGHLWMKNVLSQRGGNYKQIDIIELHEIASLSVRVATMSAKLKAAETQLKQGGATRIDTLGLEAFRDTVQKLERHIGTLSDCVDQWEAHRPQEETAYEQ